MKRLILHLISIIFYFPIVIIMFWYLLFHPKKMEDFYLGMEAITNILLDKKEKT